MVPDIKEKKIGKKNKTPNSVLTRTNVCCFQIRIFGLCLYIQNMFLKIFLSFFMTLSRPGTFHIAQAGLASAS